MTASSKKIAFVVEEDGEHISAHFGRARSYLVLTIEGGEIVDREMRDKHVAHGAGRGEGAGGGHGARHDDSHRHERHRRMVEPIQDCQLLVARGMGGGASNHLEEAGIETILTDHQRVDSAAQAYLAGKLEHHGDRLHARGGHHDHD